MLSPISVLSSEGNNGMTLTNGRNSEKKRLLRVTAENIRQSHIYVNGHYDFFPADCFGGPKRSSATAAIEIQFDGLDKTVAISKE